MSTSVSELSRTRTTNSAFNNLSEGDRRRELQRQQNEGLLDQYGLTGDFRQAGLNAINSFNAIVSSTSRGIGDTVSGLFGRSGYDKIIDNARNDLFTELKQLYNNQREEEYNSAPAAAARERSAGINPDLAGNVDSGQATEFNEPADVGAAIREAPTGLEEISGVVQGALSIYSSLASIQSTLAGTGLTKAQTAGVLADNDIKPFQLENVRLDFTDKENQFFKKVFNHIHTSKQVDDLLKGNSLELDVPSDTALISAGLRSKKQRDRYRAFQEAYVDSFLFAIEGFSKEGEYLGAEADVARKRSDASRPKGNPFDSSFVQLPSGAVISRRSNMHEGYISGLRTLAQYERDVLELNYKFNKEYLAHASGRSKAMRENAENKYNFEYFDKSDGGLKAQLEAATNRFNERVQKVKLDTINKLITADDPFSMCLALQALGEAPVNNILLGTNALGAGLSSGERAIKRLFK